MQSRDLKLDFVLLLILKSKLLGNIIIVMKLLRNGVYEEAN